MTAEISAPSRLRRLRPLLAVWAALCYSAAEARPPDHSIVYIRCERESGRASEGSGVVVSAQGHVLTAYHVVKNASACFGSRGEKRVNTDWRLLQRDRINRSDAALMQFAPRNNESPFQPVRYLPSTFFTTHDRRGARIDAFGFPRASTGDYHQKDGSLSNLTPDDADRFSGGAAVSKGMSGGPVMMGDGLVGVVWGSELDDQTSEQIDFPIIAAHLIARKFGEMRSCAMDGAIASCGEKETPPSVGGTDLGDVADGGSRALDPIEIFTNNDFVIAVRCQSPSGEELQSPGVIYTAEGYGVTDRILNGKAPCAGVKQRSSGEWRRELHIIGLDGDNLFAVFKLALSEGETVPFVQPAQTPPAVSEQVTIASWKALQGGAVAGAPPGEQSMLASVVSIDPKTGSFITSAADQTTLYGSLIFNTDGALLGIATPTVNPSAGTVFATGGAPPDVLYQAIADVGAKPQL